MGKCVYCGKVMKEPLPLIAGKEKEIVSCCGERCAEKTLLFYRYVDRTKPFFLIGVLLSTALILGSAVGATAAHSIRWLAILMGSGFAMFGLTVLLFPFATPETFALLGIRKTIWITRIFGLCSLTAGMVAAIVYIL